MTLLQVRGVSRRFSGLVALDDVSVQADEGELLGIMGPNGSGKSTLLNVIAGELRPDRGEVMLAGRSLAGAGAHRRCQHGIGRTFQHVSPFPDMSVHDNVVAGAVFGQQRRPLPLRRARRDAEEALDLVGLTNAASRRAGALSLAEKKRLELARAVATGPRLLLVDELMAGIHPASLSDMVTLLTRVRDRGITVVVVEHVVRAMRKLADRLVVLHHGKVITDGPPGDVLADAQVQHLYLGRRSADAAG